MRDKPTVLDLFSGIGGFSLGLERTGFSTVAFCEIEDYPRKVLAKHWPGIPIYNDVRTLTKERLDADGIGPIDIICGGYPCQPYSNAGNRGGKEDDRALWPEAYRLVRELRPSWCIFENVAGHISMGLDETLSDLEREGYTAEPFVIPACAIGADHRRDRVWIIAYPNGEYGEQCAPEPILGEPNLQIKPGGGFKNQGERPSTAEAFFSRESNGVPSRVDRLKGLGNAVVPQIPEIIGRAIMSL